jgi:cytochrome-b5 reductase
LIQHILRNPKDHTKISLIFANIAEEDILLRTELEALAREHPGRLNLYYTLDNPPEGWTQGRGYVSKEMIKEHLPGPGQDVKIFVCGPPG